MTDPTVEGEVVDATVTGGELVPHDHAHAGTTTLFRSSDPVEVIAQASRVADALKSVLQRQGLTTNIQGKAHVRVEGWTTLGSMLGVVPVVAWTRKLDNGWEARCEARTLDGRVVGAAEAQCTRDERMWQGRDEYALRSMAQTRATSKALRGPLGFIVTLAGYDATPAEEMAFAPAPASASASASAPAQGERKPRSEHAPPDDWRPGNDATPAQLKFLNRLRKDRQVPDASWRLLLDQHGITDEARLSKHQASRLIEQLKNGPVPSADVTTDVPAPDGFDA